MLSFIFRLLLCQYFCRIIRGDKILLSESNRDNVHIAFIFHLKPFFKFFHLSFFLKAAAAAIMAATGEGLSFLKFLPHSQLKSQVHSSPFKRSAHTHTASSSPFAFINIDHLHHISLSSMYVCMYLVDQPHIIIIITISYICLYIYVLVISIY